MAQVITKSIGAGANYSTPTAWGAAMPADLVASDIIWKGEASNGVYGALAFAGSTTDATRYGWLTAAPGHAYNPRTGFGARIAVDNATCCTIGLVGTRIEGFGFVRTTGTGNVVDINSTSVILKRCVAVCTHAAVTGAMVGFFRQAGAPILEHCIAIGGGVADQGMSIGFDGNAGTMTARHCIAYNVTGLVAGAANGFEDVTCVNCLSLGSQTADYVAGSVTKSGSSDATGTAGFQTQVAATIWEAPASFDFRLRKAATALINLGDPISGVSQDFVGAPIDATPDVGAYQFTPTPAVNKRYGEGVGIGRADPWHGRVGVKTRG